MKRLKRKSFGQVRATWSGSTARWPPAGCCPPVPTVASLAEAGQSSQITLTIFLTAPSPLRRVVCVLPRGPLQGGALCDDPHDSVEARGRQPAGDDCERRERVVSVRLAQIFSVLLCNRQCVSHATLLKSGAVSRLCLLRWRRRPMVLLRSDNGWHIAPKPSAAELAKLRGGLDEHGRKPAAPAAEAKGGK